MKNICLQSGLIPVVWALGMLFGTAHAQQFPSTTTSTSTTSTSTTTQEFPTTTTSSTVTASTTTSTTIITSTTTTIIPSAGSIEKVSGDGAQVANGSPATLVVELLDAAGQPAPGVRVSWVTPSTGTLASATTVTGSDGRSSNTVVVHAPGTQSVTAGAGGFGSVTFTVTAGLSNISGLNDAQKSVGTAIDVVCPSGKAAPELQRDCNALYVNAPDQSGVSTALQQVSSEKFTAQGTDAIKLSNAQSANIGARLAALRGGATGVSLQHLTFNLDGTPLSGAMLAALTPKGLSGGAASADEGSPFGKLGIFVNGNFYFGNQSPTNRETGFDYNTQSVTGGADYRFTPDLVLGSAFSYASTGANLDNSGGNLDSKAYAFSLYGTYYHSKSLYLDGIATYGWNNYDSRRNIVYSLPTVDVQQTAKGSTDGNQYLLSLGAGYDLSRQALTFGPYGRLSYIHADIGGFQENIDSSNPGSGWALKVDSQVFTSLTTALGGQVSYAISRPWGVLVPQGRAEWQHEFQDNSRLITASFVQDSGGVLFGVPTDNPDRDYFNLGVGLSAVLPKGRSAFIYYQTVVAQNNLTQHAVTLGVRLEF